MFNGLIESVIQELNYNGIMKKQSSIGRLFPTFAQRVRRVADNGGVTLVQKMPNTWQFKVTSGTKVGVSYDVYVSFLNIEELINKFVQDRGLWNKSKTNIDYRQLASEMMNSLDIETDCSCLTGDTKIPLLDSRVLTIEEIYNEFGTDKEFWVYSSDERGNFVPKKARCLGITGLTTNLVEVTLDNDRTVKCTYDHRFRMRDGSYKEAKDLKPEDSLMPIYFSKTTKKGKSKYQQLYVTVKKNLVRTETGANNHKVKSIKFLKLTQNVPVYDLFVQDTHNFALDAGVYVHNCPADLYWGPEYIKTQRQAQFGHQEHRPPDIRNPKQYGALCKHGELVFEVLPMFVSTFASFLKDYWNKEVQKALKMAIQGIPPGLKAAALTKQEAEEEKRQMGKPAPRKDKGGRPSKGVETEYGDEQLTGEEEIPYAEAGDGKDIPTGEDLGDIELGQKEEPVRGKAGKQTTKVGTKPPSKTGSNPTRPGTKSGVKGSSSSTKPGTKRGTS